VGRGGWGAKTRSTDVKPLASYVTRSTDIEVLENPLEGLYLVLREWLQGRPRLFELLELAVEVSAAAVSRMGRPCRREGTTIVVFVDTVNEASLALSVRV
jgi:hypothetical protein